MERSGPGIELKVVIVAVVGVLLQDAALAALYFADAGPTTIQVVLGAVLVITLIVAAAWGNSLSRALRQLARSCYVARKGDTNVLTQLPRSDEVGQVNDEINKLVVLIRELTEARDELSTSSEVTGVVSQTAPELLRSSQEALVSLKELREGATAEAVILRRLANKIEDARRLVEAVARPAGDRGAAEDVASKLKSMTALSKETEFLADQVIDEVARPDIDEAALARAVNGMRDAARTMSEVASQAIAHLDRRRADAEAASLAVEALRSADAEKQDGARVAELMERSAGSGLSAASRLGSTLRRLGVVLEAYEERRRFRV